MPKFTACPTEASHAEKPASRDFRRPSDRTPTHVPEPVKTENPPAYHSDMGNRNAAGRLPSGKTLWVNQHSVKKTEVSPATRFWQFAAFVGNPDPIGTISVQLETCRPHLARNNAGSTCRLVHGQSAKLANRFVGYGVHRTGQIQTSYLTSHRQSKIVQRLVLQN